VGAALILAGIAVATLWPPVRKRSEVPP